MTDQPVPTVAVPAQDFAQRLSTALRRSPLTLEAVAGQLAARGHRVSVTTLSYWGSGRTMPRRENSLRALAELEAVLALPSGHLLDRLPARDGSGPRTADVSPAEPSLHEVLATMDFGGAHWRGLTNADHVTIAPNGSEAAIVADQVVMATRAGLRVLPAIYYQDGDAPATPTVVALRGCRVGQMVQVPSSRLVVAEIVLGHALVRGETASFSYRIDCEPTTVRSQRWERALNSHTSTQVTTITFQGEPPREASRYHLPGPLEEGLHLPADGSLPGTPLPIDPCGIQAVVCQAATGVHGVAWRW